VSVPVETRPRIGLRGGSPRHLLGAALLVAALAAVLALVAVLLAGGSSHRSTHRAKVLARTPTPASAAVPLAGSSAPGVRRSVAEVRDPEEARSFPVSGSVHHKAAATPATAAEAEFHPSPGAASNAEVARELHAEERAQIEERASNVKGLAAVAGGQSIGGDGALPIPANVPEVVQKVVAGANSIADFPYVYGGGHASFVDNAYDCSGSVSYALAAGGLLSAPETSGELESWGVPGPGRYITVLANAGHTYMYVDGVLYDTAGRSGVYASRWQVGEVDNAGYVVRHWPGL
jgi:cell wall-associated NlpC family hydrolase